MNDRTVTTRGDANGADDPMPTEADRIVGRMWYSVPFLGYLTMVLNFSMSRDIWLIVDVLIAVVLILVNTVLPKILKKKKRGDSDE